MLEQMLDRIIECWEKLPRWGKLILATATIIGYIWAGVELWDAADFREGNWQAFVFLIGYEAPAIAFVVNPQPTPYHYQEGH